MRSLLALTILSVILVGAFSQDKKCGSNGAYALFEAEVFLKLDAMSQLQYKANLDAYKAMAPVAVTAGSLPKAIEDVVTGGKTCCTKDFLENTVKGIVKDYIRQSTDGIRGNGWAFGVKKTTAFDACKIKIQNAQTKCFKDWMKANMPTGSVSGSVEVSGSVSVSISISLPESILKLQKAMKAEQKKQQSCLKNGYGGIAKALLQLVRGTRVALCLDPNVAKDNVFKDGAFVASQASFDALAADIKAALAGINKANNATKNTLAYERDLAKKNRVIPCDVAAIVTECEKSLDICPGDADCSKTASACIGAFSIGCLTSAQADVPEEPAMRRELQTASIKPSATGTACKQEDATEDNEVQIDGQSLSAIQAEDKANDAEVTAAGPVDYAAAIDYQTASSNKVAFAFAAFAFIILSLF